jgi:hypothetical protein
MKLNKASLTKNNHPKPISAVGQVNDTDVGLKWELPPLLSSKEAARKIKIAPQTLNSWRSSRRVEIPYIKVGRKVLYRQSDISDFLTSSTHGTASQIAGVQA